MRGVCWALKMGLFLHAVGSVPPTESAEERSLLHCDGVNNQSYICESGHCCGESQCCSYYYELWWFWLVWAIIFILSCCCVCHHRRTKHRLQQQQRQHEINLIAYREAHNYPSVPFYFRFLPNYLLPDYEEVVNRPPTPPPPYSALNTDPSSVASSPLAPEQQQQQQQQQQPQEGHCPTSPPTQAGPASDGQCCRPGGEEPPPTTIDMGPEPDDKPAQAPQDLGLILSRGGGGGLEKRSEGGDDSCKDPLLKEPSEVGAVNDKERLPNGRRRRFTGDSGIEMCVCGVRVGGGSSSGHGTSGSSGQEDKETRELETLLGGEGDEEEEEEEDEDEEEGDFCHSCGQRASFSLEDEQAVGAAERRWARGALPPPPPPSVCLLLHTISEQEGPHHSTEPQG
ncbi:WW domain binding protein 1-like b [Nelusetta ayraudi]|uniref:WW domain binding protein 1-like b n=1 Tax=Nelusetta ayraudi TaxID=303726 RepID=UPI003F721C29